LEVSGEAEKLKDWAEASICKDNGKIIFLSESEVQWIQRIKEKKIKRLRLLSLPSSEALKEAGEAACHKHIASVLANGRVELLHYLREISISFDYHRYGNLGLREGEKRHLLTSTEPFKKKALLTLLHAASCPCAHPITHKLFITHKII
jgi:hypothetical protein